MTHSEDGLVWGGWSQAVWGVPTGGAFPFRLKDAVLSEGTVEQELRASLAARGAHGRRRRDGGY